MKLPLLMRMATFGHSASQAEQPVQDAVAIDRAMVVSPRSGSGKNQSAM
jgi:hypothetical protein